MPSYGVYSSERVAEVTVDKISHQSGGTLGFFGVTPTAQTAAISSVSTSVVITACGVGGFSVAQASALVVAVNLVIAALNASGLTA